MPQRIDIPPCLKEFLARLYPDVNLERVRFHRGVPWYTSPGGAITIGGDIYFREDRTDFCSARNVALAAHELYHVRDGSDGTGLWFIRPFYARYVWWLLVCGFKTDSRHRMEAPAYDRQRRVEQHLQRAEQASGESGPCACFDGEPAGPNEAFVAAFFAEWAAA